MLVGLVIVAQAVKPGTEEVHPKLTWEKCTKSGCTAQQGSVVIDHEWREVVDASGKSCLQSNGDWDGTVCSGTEDCAAKCYLNGFDYAKASVTTSGSTLRMGFVNPDGSVGSRLYLFDEAAGQYVNFNMINKEITFDIDVSTLGCGTNSAVYFSEMILDGGTSKYPSNTAGAKYGTGYCDAQCPRDGKFIGNIANVGKPYGSCCYEYDLWEANAYATQLAAHSCTTKEPSEVCQGSCGSQCDSAGCHYNPYRNPGTGDLNEDFYGKGKTVDTSKKFTVVTQFVSSNGADSGSLAAVKRLYVVGGKVIETPVMTQWDGSGYVEYNALNDTYCKSNLGGSDYVTKGGDAGWTASFKRAAVLIFSLWTDGSMSWLDEGMSGPCSSPGGKDGVISANKNSYMEVSKLRFGDIDSTY